MYSFMKNVFSILSWKIKINGFKYLKRIGENPDNPNNIMY